MPFTKPPNRIPTTIGAVRMTVTERIAIAHPLNPVEAGYSINAEIELLDAENVRVHTVNVKLDEHLTPAQINGLKNLMTAIRTKAAAELL